MGSASTDAGSSSSGSSGSFSSDDAGSQPLLTGIENVFAPASSGDKDGTGSEASGSGLAGLLGQIQGSWRSTTAPAPGSPAGRASSDAGSSGSAGSENAGSLLAQRAYLGRLLQGTVNSTGSGGAGNSLRSLFG